MKTVDWFEVIMDMRRAGMSCPEIARRCRMRGVEVSGTTINGLMNGAWSEPRYSLGVCLIELREIVMRQSAELKAA